MNAFGLNCLKYCLGPLLWLQGQQVRKRTLVLPEPAGQRVGQTGHGRLIRILILGDSSAAGVGVSDQRAGLLGHILQALNTEHRINYELRAHTGARTRDTLNDLLYALDRDWPSDVKFDVVVTALGVNDVTAQLSLTQWRRQQDLLVKTIHQKLSPQHIIVSGLPPMHLFPALPAPLRHYLGSWANLFNEALEKVTAQHSATTFLSVRDLAQPLDVAEDGFHPGPETYQRWGQAVARLIQQRY